MAIEQNEKELQDMQTKDEANQVVEENKEAKEEENKAEEIIESQLKKELENSKKQCDEYLNRLMRLQADFDNYKKRVAKEREDMYTFALENIVLSILPVMDNMERAVSSFKSDNLDAKYVEGIEMVQKQLVSVMEKNGVKEIPSEGCDFDPNFHHAVMQCEAEEGEDNKIKMVMQKGYMLGNKVIRPSLVQVAVKN
jgi:molecular chaperone GrpE